MKLPKKRFCSPVRRAVRRRSGSAPRHGSGRVGDAAAPIFLTAAYGPRGGRAAPVRRVRRHRLRGGRCTAHARPRQGAARGGEPSDLFAAIRRRGLQALPAARHHRAKCDATALAAPSKVPDAGQSTFNANRAPCKPLPGDLYTSVGPSSNRCVPNRAGSWAFSWLGITVSIDVRFEP